MAPGTRLALAGPIVALITLVLAAAVGLHVGVPLRDPGHITVVRLATATAALLVVAFAVRLSGRGPERWTWRRAAVMAVALLSFYLTYFAYRNLKSDVAIARPGVSFDTQLGDIDRALFAHHSPAVLLHDALGTGAAAHVLARVYMAFFVFIPIVLAVALGGACTLRTGLFVTTALALGWLLGAAGYFLLPSLGPFADTPRHFAGLPATSVTHMQQSLVGDRRAFLADPGAAGAAQSIGAFPSLHVAVYATVSIAAQVVGAPRWLKVLLWLATALTAISTVYFGWHYLADDVAGVVIGGLAVGLTVAAGRVRVGRRPALTGELA